MSRNAQAQRVLALCGGIGGAKLALGLNRLLGKRLSVVVNTGDDFEHLGLGISPDLDTVLYTLGGLADPERGWGRAQETWHFMESLRELGGENWFQLGDRDLAIHIVRTAWLRSGRTLSEFAAHAAQQFGIEAEILPMSDDTVRTIVETDEGALSFQHYFVKCRCEPVVRAIRFAGAAEAKMPVRISGLLADPSLQAIVICPSNPYLSVDPILAVPGFAAALATASAPVIAVSPIVGGQAVKGPTAKIMAELNISPSNNSIAAHYRGLIDGLIIDESDAAGPALDVPTWVTKTMMRDLADRESLASEVLAFADTLTQNKTVRQSRGRR